MLKTPFVEAKRGTPWPSEPPVWGEMLAPFGPLCVLVGPRGLERIVLPRKPPCAVDAQRDDADVRVTRVKDQLREYFAGTRRGFDLPLDPSGTDMSFDLPIRFALAGRFTVPEARGRPAFEEGARALAPARPLRVQ